MSEELYVINSVTELLKYTNLSDDQKHEHFHIASFKEDLDKFPEIINLRSESYFEVTVSRNSNTKVLIDDTKISSELDLITFLSPGQSININRKEEGKLKEGYIIFFTVDFLDFSPTIFSLIQKFPYFNMHFSPAYSLNKEQINYFFELMNKIYHKFKSPNSDDFEIIKSYLNILLFEAKKLSNELVATSHSRAEEITYRFENLLKQKEKKPLVKDYATMMNISPIYLSECVKSTTGKSAKKVITEYKIREAKSLLANTEKTIDEIAEYVGFDDRSNFINFFKKNLGIAPNKYRKQNSST